MEKVSGTGKKILNPQTIIYLENSSTLEMETVQIKGVDSTERTTTAYLKDNSNLIVSEKILTPEHKNTSFFYKPSLTLTQFFIPHIETLCTRDKVCYLENRQLL